MRRTRRLLLAGFLVSCGPAPAAPARPIEPAQRPAMTEAAARAVCPTDPMGEIGTALPALVAGCNLVPPWTEHAPFVRCPDAGCPRPCKKTSNRFGSGAETAVTRYRYDPSGRLIEAVRSRADGRPMDSDRWQYTSPQRWRRTDSVLGDFGYEFDEQGRLIARDSESLRHVYERGPDGKLTAERVESRKGRGPASEARFAFVFDGKGRLASVERTQPSPFTELVYTYADGGLLETATLRSRRWHLRWDGLLPVGAARGAKPDALRLRYDEQGRPIEITDETGGFDRYDYACAD